VIRFLVPHGRSFTGASFFRYVAETIEIDGIPQYGYNLFI
jgi:hypothetical protein